MKKLNSDRPRVAANVNGIGFVKLIIALTTSRGQSRKTRSGWLTPAIYLSIFPTSLAISKR